MSNYVKATNFASKDALPSGNANKIIKGTEIDTEFNAIASAITSKADTNSPTFTGTPLAPTASPGTNNTQVATTAFAAAAATAAVTAANLGTIATQNANNVAITGGSVTGITDIAVADGGTGRSTLTANNLLAGNGTSAVNLIAPGTNGQVLQSNGTTWAAATLTENSVGVGQTWQNVLSSRSTYVTYTNTTGRPIVVIVSSSDGEGRSWESYRAIVDGLTFRFNHSGDFGGAGSCTIIVPNNSTYRIEGFSTRSGTVGSPQYWIELR